MFLIFHCGACLLGISLPRLFLCLCIQTDLLHQPTVFCLCPVILLCFLCYFFPNRLQLCLLQQNGHTRMDLHFTHGSAWILSTTSMQTKTSLTCTGRYQHHSLNTNPEPLPFVWHLIISVCLNILYIQCKNRKVITQCTFVV